MTGSSLRSVLCMSFLVTACCFSAAARAQAKSSFSPGFNSAHSRALLGQPAAFTTCPAVPDPVVDMGGYVSRYAVGDATQSRVDPAREAKAKPRDSALESFATSLAQLSDHALTAQPPLPNLNACILHQLAVWARAGALEKNVDQNSRIGRNQAIMMQAWNASNYANVLAKIGGLQSMQGDDAKAVTAWLRRLASSIMEEYAGEPGWQRPDNNHLYWAGFAVGAIGAQTEDRAMLSFARNTLRQALNDVDDAGALPKEMERGERSFMYQNFATVAIAGLVELADQNGLVLHAAEERKLARLCGFNAEGITHAEQIDKRTGVHQTFQPSPTELAWIDILLPHFQSRNPSLAQALDRIMRTRALRPAWHIWMGGNVTAAYNSEALVQNSSEAWRQ